MEDHARRIALDALDKADEVAKRYDRAYLTDLLQDWKRAGDALHAYRQAAAEARKMLQPGYAQKEIIRKGQR